jgi:hypothetical protein
MITESKFTIDEEIPTLLVKETDKNFNNVKLKIREESFNFYPEGIENSVFDLAESNSNETKNSIANNNLEKPVDSSNELTIINNTSKEELDLESESNNNDNNNQNEELKKDSTQTNLSETNSLKIISSTTADELSVINDTNKLEEIDLASESNNKETNSNEELTETNLNETNDNDNNNKEKINVIYVEDCDEIKEDVFNPFKTDNNRSKLSKLYWIITLPLTSLFYFTIPGI